MRGRGVGVNFSLKGKNLGFVWYGVMEWTGKWNGRGNEMDEVMELIITIPCLVWLPCENGMNHYFLLFGMREKMKE
ncbi:hypothetical protein HanRHA438_Chr01g0004241 [Helianthus annuus]|nr:hypothetical protein HanRHA438_Chr01g0004241 [Helianthus annuus]